MLEETRSWPFVEARKILSKINNKTPDKGYVLFETGYGPSGLPHIGTFGEVARTTMVRHAFETISDIPTKLVAFSDDMDALRKVPTNVPNQKMLEQYIGMPLTKVPDPFEKYESFAHHNNAKLREFLDRFEFDYEFRSSTEMYQTGVFNDTLFKVLKNYNEIQALMLSTLREERASTYSPFLPICEKTGKILQVPMEYVGDGNGADVNLIFKGEDGGFQNTWIFNGEVKLQWKVDWAMRWVAFDVDYEMSGKDLISSVDAASKICKIIGGNPPINLTYELFLDENGQKVSKSKGNGVSIETWLEYGPPESLALFLFQNPKAAKKMGISSIPRVTDEYLSHLVKYNKDNTVTAFDNPVWHIHGGNVPEVDEMLSFTVLLNLANVADITDEDAMWKYIKNIKLNLSPENATVVDGLVRNAINYYQMRVKHTKIIREATEDEKTSLKDLADILETLPETATSEEIQYHVYEIGKKQYTDLKMFFQMLYEVLLGQQSGPRMGQFFILYGLSKSIELLRSKI